MKFSKLNFSKLKYSGSRPKLAAGVGVLAGALALAFLPTSYGAYTSTVRNTANTSAISIDCEDVVREAGAYAAYPLDETGGTTAADVSGNNRTGVYSAAGITYAQAGPCSRDTGRSVAFNGSSGAAAGNNATFNPQTVTMQIWFRTNATNGGKMIGLGNLRTGSSNQYDRHLYLANTGQVVWGVYPGAVKTLTSPQAYNNNVWHQAVGTLAPAGSANPGQRLYVDGVLVASDTTVVSAQDFAGFIRIGYDNMASWNPQPTNSYFTGRLAWASVYTTALTPAQIQRMYTVGA